MQYLGIGAFVSKIASVEVKDIVNAVLSSERKLAGGAAIVLGTFLNNYGTTPKLLSEDVSIVEKGFYITSIALPLVLYCKGVQVLSNFAAPMLAFSVYEMQLIKSIGIRLVKEGAPTESCLSELFMYAFANERFCKRFTKVMEQKDTELLERFYNYHEVLHQFTYNTQGLTLSIVTSLSEKLRDKVSLTFQEIVWVERLSRINMDQWAVECVADAAMAAENLILIIQVFLPQLTYPFSDFRQ